MQYDTRCSGHTTRIKHVKSHPERPLLVTMGEEQYRDRGELIVWHVQPVRVMDASFSPLTSIAKVKTTGKWDPSLSMFYAA